MGGAGAGPVWAPISPSAGSLFHADPHLGEPAQIGRWRHPGLKPPPPDAVNGADFTPRPSADYTGDEQLRIRPGVSRQKVEKPAHRPPKYETHPEELMELDAYVTVADIELISAATPGETAIKTVCRLAGMAESSFRKHRPKGENPRLAVWLAVLNRLPSIEERSRWALDRATVAGLRF